MIFMKVKIKYDWTYNRQFNLSISENEFENKIWKSVLTKGKMFEKLYNKHIGKIIKLIPRFSGYEWCELSDEFIPIYLVKKKGFCFSDPLTLNIGMSNKMMLVALVHELCHRNMPFPIKNEADPLKTEILMNLVTDAVFKNLDIKADKEVQSLIDSTKDIYKETYKPIDLDVSRITVKKYMKNKR